MESLKGRLLVAGPHLQDPNFWRTVVLIAEHTDEGAMGVVLNRPSETTVGDATPQLDGLTPADEAVHLGGPVQPSAVVVLAEFDDVSLAATPVLGDVGFVSTGTDVGDLSGLTRRARVFAGYAGWGVGQLEMEVERDDWMVLDATREDVFAPDPSELWAKVLERQGGQHALVARMPLDPSLN